VAVVVVDLAKRLTVSTFYAENAGCIFTTKNKQNKHKKSNNVILAILAKYISTQITT
jgi:hypothetical protein